LSVHFDIEMIAGHLGSEDELSQRKYFGCYLIRLVTVRYTRTLVRCGRTTCWWDTQIV